MYIDITQSIVQTHKLSFSFCNEIGQSYSEVSATLCWSTLYTVSDQTTQEKEINVVVM